MRVLKQFFRSFAPEPVVSAYHPFIAHLAAFVYRNPSRKLLIVAVTGTKGKSSVTEMVSRILEEARYRTAVLNSIRFKIGDESLSNTTRMSMPGRFFIQSFLAVHPIVGQDHLLHQGQPFFGKEHMLGAAESDPFRA